MEQPPASADGDDVSTPFDAEEIVWLYRYARDTKDTAECERLLNVWKERQSEDSLHEMAWGKPIERKAREERINTLIERHHGAMERWPGTVHEIGRGPSGEVVHITKHSSVIGDIGSAEARESQAMLKELRWVFFRAYRFLPEDAVE